MATDTQDSMPTDTRDLVSLSLTHHSNLHTFSFPSEATISDLSDAVAEDLFVPPTNQKFMIAKLGLLKQPFKDRSLLLSTIADKKITLMGSTVAEANSITHAASEHARFVNRRPVMKVKAYKTKPSQKELEESQYTFTTLQPLPYLPNPARSLQFLQRLKDDAGIKAVMRKHKFTVPLLTEMNPIEHTQSNAEGTTRTLGLNRNKGEVIELRLRTDAYDGYRDYKTIRKTLCHELAHNIQGPHDRIFWDICKKIEKEVEGADYRSSGRTVGEEGYHAGNEDYHGEEVDDHGGWTGGEFVLGAGSAGGTESIGSTSSQGMSRREILAKAAEERIKRMREQEEQTESAGSASS